MVVDAREYLPDMFRTKKLFAFSHIGQNTNRGARNKRNDDRCDHFLVNSAGTTYTVLVVADGVTTAQGSAQASEIAVKEIRNYLTSQPVKGSVRRWLESAIISAHRNILQISQIYPEWRTMCTTVVAAIVANDQLYIAHLGDSRAYLIRSNAIFLLTKDHTWVQEAIDHGMMTEKAAKVHPKRHVVKRFLGIQDKIAVDTAILKPVGHNQFPNGKCQMTDAIKIGTGDSILLCTDGLTDKIDDDEILQTVKRHARRPQKAVDALIKLALKRKEGDNITALLINIPDMTSALS